MALRAQLLYEPTSALDPLVDSEILAGLLNSAEGRTAVIVSHRVGICRHVDRIHVMDAGRIVESGSHEELMRSGGHYSRLFSEQAKWYA